MSDSSPVATIVVTAFEEGPLLRQCLNSVLSQTDARFECIIIDDASETDTVEFIASDILDDKRIRLIQNPRNIGLAASRNIGLEAARTPLITFLDADDFLFPSALESRVASIRYADDNGTLSGSFCNWIFVAEDERPHDIPPKQPSRRHATWLDCVDDNLFIASAPLISTQAARLVGGFDERLGTAEDYDFWARLLRQGFALRACSYVGVGYRQKRSSMYRTTAQAHVRNQIAIYRWNYSKLKRREIAHSAPFPFRRPPGAYRVALNEARRFSVGAVNALHSNDAAALEEFCDGIRQRVEPWMWWAANWRTLIHKTADRLEGYETAGFEERRGSLETEAIKVLMPILKVPGHPWLDEDFGTKTAGLHPTGSRG